jgi:hypothetical protein
VEVKGLQQANPHILDATNLKVGQEIRLPQNQGSQTLKQDDDESAGHELKGESNLPRSPIGDSLAQTAMQSRLASLGQKKQSLSAADLPQVAGAAQQKTVNALKYDSAGEKPWKAHENFRNVAADKFSPLQATSSKIAPMWGPWKADETPQDITVNKANAADKASLDISKFMKP